MTQRSLDAHGPLTALFAGSFNPYTIGHADIVRRGLEMFGKVVICIGINIAKPGEEVSAAKRVAAIAALYADEPRVEVMHWSGLTVDAARHCGAQVLLRGVRSVKDFEYERDMADVNRQISGIDTVLLLASPELACVSSSVVRELAAYGHDISAYLPQPTCNQ